MTKSIPGHLRLFTDFDFQPPVVTPAVQTQLPDLLHSFESVTGWSLRFVPGASAEFDSELLWSANLNPSDLASTGELRMELGAHGERNALPRVELDDAITLATHLANLLNDLAAFQKELRSANSQLALEIPVIAADQSAAEWKARLESVLKSSAEAIGCQAAGLYILDEGTRVLSLRAASGLKTDAFLPEARELKYAKADLEALCGHSVTVRGVEGRAAWNAPENYEASLCLPVRGQGEPLGTVWYFSTNTAAFTEHQLNVAELVSGRLASELERELLLRDRRANARLEKEAAAVARNQKHRRPSCDSLAPTWQVSAWAANEGASASPFYDWFLAPDDQLWFTVGHADGGGLQSVVSVATLQASLRAHGDYADAPLCWLQKTNRSLWMTSSGDQAFSVGGGMLSNHAGRVEWTLAGQCAAWVLNENTVEDCRAAGASLGGQPNWLHHGEEAELAIGELFVIATFANGANLNLPEISSAYSAPLPRVIDALKRHWRNRGRVESIFVARRCK